MFRYLFGNDLPQVYRESVLREATKRNFHRSIPLNMVIVVLEALFFLLSYTEYTDGLYGEYTSVYRLLYLIMMAYAAFLLVIVKLYGKVLRNKASVSEHMMYVSVGFFIIWSGVVSVIDMSRGLTGYTYLFIVIVIGVVLVMRPRRSVWIYIVSHSVFLMLNYIFQLPNELIFSNIINATALVVTSFVISVIIYRSFCNYYVAQQIIIEQKRDLEVLVSKDHLTDLYNRRGLEAFLDQLSRNEEEISVGILMIDIDYFKGYNDTYGHIMGDKALQSVANVIKERIAGYEGIGCRYGGDEFCAVIVGCSMENLRFMKKQITHDIQQMGIANEADKRSGLLTVSVGLYLGEATEHQDLWSYIDSADELLYETKRAR